MKIIFFSLMVSLIALILMTSGSVSACTGFTASNNKTVLVGHNKDWNDSDFWIRFFPPENGTYGRFYYENEWPLDWNPDWHCPQGGMNDQGLFYDTYYTPLLSPTNSSDKPSFWNDSDHYKCSIEAYCLAHFSTVEEVLGYFGRYNLAYMERHQILFADRTGSSIIIECDDIIHKEGDFQVVTNFLQSHPELGGYPCWRYDTAVSMLENMTDLSISYFRDICDATQLGGSFHTQYSNICDLKRGIIYLFHDCDYDHLKIFNLSEELELGPHVYHISELSYDDSIAPFKPTKPIGPIFGKTDVEYTYTSSATDPNNGQIYYLFDWDDRTDSGWLGPYNSGDECSTSHIWNRTGNFEVRVKAKDTNDQESPWSDPLPVSMPKTYENPLWSLIAKIFDWLEQIFGRVMLPGISNL